MSDCVLDASAVLAVALQEPGRDVVRPRVPGALLSTVNYQEVVEVLAARGRPTATLLAFLRNMRLEVVPFSIRQAELAAALKPVAQPHGVSLADRACLALAKETGRPVLTADRVWAELDVGVTVELIR